ncbi:MAG: FAD-dependent oxidoreductase [Acidobacteria bacterium]|nr:FAD-dependent oxidoreductase [Acidobacteriota bacterium]
MPRVIVIGGGLAGMSAAAALASAGWQTGLFESRPFLGGRATSYLLPGDAGPQVIDNCQHILLRCCVNLLDFYRRAGVVGRIRFHREFHFLEPGGRRSTLRAGALPAPLHFAGSFARLRFLSLSDKLAIARALVALKRERTRRDDLDRISMADWLAEKRQPAGAVERFWRPVIVSAVNDVPERIAARYGFLVFWLGFLASATGYEMGIPEVPLGELYARLDNVNVRLRAPVESVAVEAGRVTGLVAGGELHTADWYVLAVPFERVPALVPALDLDTSAFEHSSITGIHLWFDRPVTRLPHAALLDRTIQWFFRKDDGRYLQLVVSASRDLLAMSRQDVIALALKELAEFLPEVRQARLETAHVVKEARATFSAQPGLDAARPGPRTPITNLFLAGDWTRTGWPATMEGAVRSGYLAAEAATAAGGAPRRFLVA